MENQFLQSLKKFSKRELPNLEAMSKEELIAFIRKNCRTKEQLTLFIKICYLAGQQTFYDSYCQGEDVNFQILEGDVHYDPCTEVYTFTPNATFKKLLDSATMDSTRLKEVLLTRFYKMVETLYKLEKK